MRITVTKILFTALYCSFYLTMYSSNTIIIDQETNDVDISQDGEYYLDKSRELSIDDVRKETFIDQTNLDVYERPYNLDLTYWSKFRMHNHSDSFTTIVLESGLFHKQTLFVYKLNQLIETKTFGIAINKSDWPLAMGDTAVDIELSPNEEYTIYLKKEFPRINRRFYHAKLYKVQSFNVQQNNLYYQLKSKYFFRVLFIGILAFLCLFTIFQYIQHRDLSYLYYSGYLLIMSIYFLERHESNPFLNVIFSNNAFLFNPNGGGEPSFYSQLSFIFYILFTIYFLDLKKKNKLLTKYFYLLNAMIIFCYAIHLGMLLFDAKPSTIFNFYYSYRAVWNIPLLISLIWIAFSIRTKLAAFYLIGSFVLTLTMILPQFMYLFEQRFGGPFFSDNMTWMQLGMLFECFLFSTGLGYKSKMAFEERDRIQQKLLQKSKENADIQKKYNSKLQEEVKLKSSEIVSQKEELFKREYEMNMMDLEAKMLQSKMNPHFIYNCLNSIKYFAISKTPDQTAQYITDFASLMRTILENSRENFITIKEELEFIQKYLQIECRRFENTFSYHLRIDPAIDKDFWHIPPMILQPIIENSLVHGLLPKNDIGKIRIEMNLIHEQINIIITDDGVGRQEADSNNKVRDTIEQNKTSLSSMITDSRLHNINKRYDINIGIDITDLLDLNGKAAGTSVSVNIPILIKNSEKKLERMYQ